MFEGQDLRGVQNSAVDSHPNGRGHAILARGMEDCLSRSGLLRGKPGYVPSAYLGGGPGTSSTSSPGSSHQ